MKSENAKIIAQDAFRSVNNASVLFALFLWKNLNYFSTFIEQIVLIHHIEIYVKFINNKNKSEQQLFLIYI